MAFACAVGRIPGSGWKQTYLKSHKWHIKKGMTFPLVFDSLRDIPNMWKPVLLQFRGPAFFRGILRVGNYPNDTFVKLEVSDISPLPMCHPRNLLSQKNRLEKAPWCMSLALHKQIWAPRDLSYSADADLSCWQGCKVEDKQMWQTD